MAQVLILEDDELLSSLLAIALERAGYASVSVSNVGAARIELESGSYDLIVSDHILDGEHLGDEFTADSVRSGLVRSAILISGWADMRKPENRQVSAFLQKPFTMQAFLDVVKEGVGEVQTVRDRHASG